MASVIKIGNKWRAQVVDPKAGKRITKTFAKKTDADAWGRKLESEIDAGLNVGINGKTGMTISEAIKKYKEDRPNLGITLINLLGYIARGLGHKVLDKLTDDDVVDYIRGRKLGKMSVSMEISTLTGMLTMARVGWKHHVPDIIPVIRARLKLLNLIGNSEERVRRPTPEEIKLLCAYDFHTEIPMANIIMFAIHSTMRQSEITRIKRGTFDRTHKTVVITDRKHPTKKKGNHQTVPLLDAAIEIIDQQPIRDKKNKEESIFPYKPRTIGTYFTNACRKLKIEDLHFHDLRHEGISRLFEMGYQIHEVTMFSGHLDWKQLKRYTQLKAKDLRRIEAEANVSDEKKKIKELEAMIKKLTAKQTEMT